MDIGNIHFLDTPITGYCGIMGETSRVRERKRRRGFQEGAGEKMVRCGKWWGPVRLPTGECEQREVDIAVETGRRLCLRECRWGGADFSAGDLTRLKESAGPPLRRRWKGVWRFARVLFAHGEFLFFVAADGGVFQSLEMWWE